MVNTTKEILLKNLQEWTNTSFLIHNTIKSIKKGLKTATQKNVMENLYLNKTFCFYFHSTICKEDKLYQQHSVRRRWYCSYLNKLYAT